MFNHAGPTRTVATAAAALMLSAALVACGGGEEKADEAPAEATATAAAAEAPAAPATPPGPPAVEGYDWYSRVNDEERSRSMVLAYEMPDTDDQALMFSCEEGGQRIFASVDSVTTGVGAIILRSGEAVGMYPVTERQASEMSGGEFLTVEIPASDGTLQAFATNGWINLGLAGVTRDLPAHPAGRAAITAFFAFCSAPPETQPETPAEVSPG